jgi:hypothetical protein
LRGIRWFLNGPAFVLIGYTAHDAFIDGEFTALVAVLLGCAVGWTLYIEIWRKLK